MRSLISCGAVLFPNIATGRVTWEPPPLREESPTSQNSQVSQADIDLAFSAASALIHDNEVLSSRINNYEAALNGVLNEVQNYREQAAALATSKVQTKQLIACLTDAADKREELLRQRASSCLRIHELMDIIHDSLESLGDVHLDALIDGMAKENHGLWQMVRLAQNAANSPVPPAPVFRWPLVNPLKGREARKRAPKAPEAAPKTVPGEAESAEGSKRDGEEPAKVEQEEQEDQEETMATGFCWQNLVNASFIDEFDLV
eukprot:s95_g9.t1